MLMDGGVLSGERRGGNGAEGAGARLAPGLSPGSKTLWYGVWGAMGTVACASALIAANGPPSAVAIEGRYGLLLSVLLASVATAQLVRGISFLSGKETALAAVVLVLFGFAQLGNWVLAGSSARLTTDFTAYYESGRVVAERHPERLYSLPIHPDGRASERPFLYPPLFAVVIRPFTSLSYKGAFLGWNCFTVLLIFASCLMSLKLGGMRLSVPLVLMLTVGFFSYYPVLFGLRLGQVGGLILFLWTGCVWCLVRNRIWMSAFCFAFATMIKLTPIVAVPVLVFHRKWKWLVAYGSWLFCLLAFSIWRVGWSAEREFVSKVMPNLSCGVPASQNASLVSYVQELVVGRVSSVDGSALAILPTACIAAKVVTLVVYGALMLRFHGYRGERNLIRQFILVALVSLVVSPISWWHHYTIALLPFLFLWSVTRKPSRDSLLLATVLVVGTNLVGFAVQLASNPAIQLVLAGVVPSLTLATVYFGVSEEAR